MLDVELFTYVEKFYNNKILFQLLVIFNFLLCFVIFFTSCIVDVYYYSVNLNGVVILSIAFGLIGHILVIMNLKLMFFWSMIPVRLDPPNRLRLFI
jgi:hypothetical protein